MNAHTAISSPAASDAATATPAPETASAHRHRNDGWTPDRQRRFLELIADGHTVDDACLVVGLSATSAYSFRRRAPGSAFALGWAAANLHGRERIAATLLARAIHGQKETVEKEAIDREGGTKIVTITRTRIDNRLGLHMLARADRQADAPDPHGHGLAARLVAQEFDAFLDLVERDEGPARAGLFLAARLPVGEAGAPGDSAAADLAPVVALARADRFLKAGAGLASEVDTADLDLATRATWTAEQWQRAEAAGLIAVTPVEDPDEAAREPQLSQLSDDLPPLKQPKPVWFHQGSQCWRTRFPAPEGFDGEWWSYYGAPDYQRELTAEEVAIMDTPADVEIAAQGARETIARDRWFENYLEDFATEWAEKTVAAEEAAAAQLIPPPEGEGDQPQAGGGVGAATTKASSC
ncbi:hypothetical protein [Sphingomonas sp. ID0503]|uniref:hypothetical protein n=1 Tax=Sphingomonas sp. ID0503 TaxID=3399691 RepID=UPI003AFA58B1